MLLNNVRKSLLLVPIAMLLAACQVTEKEQVNTEPTTADVGTTVKQTPTAVHVQIPDTSAQRVSESEISYTTVWERIAAGLTLHLDYSHPNIDDEVRWYTDNPEFFQQVADRAAPFLFWIVEEVDRRGLPMELALLPVVESGFDPTVYSSQSAAGLWQFMGATANNFGLQRDWWYDGRLDPMSSTHAALDYLQALYEQFDHDWLLAMAAYNTGEGNVRRALNRLRVDPEEHRFWQLRLSGETRSHVPRVLAIARIFSDPQAYGIELPTISNEPYLAVVDPGFQLDLVNAAQAAGLELTELKALNPGYRQWATHPDGPYSLLIPASQVDVFNERVTSLPAAQRMVWEHYEIKPGDTLSSIASRFDLTTDVLMQANGLTSSRIIAGRSLLLPRHDVSDLASVSPMVAAQQSLTKSPPATYRVRPGDNLWRIARRHDLRSADIAGWNDLVLDAILRPGQVLLLQPNNVN